MTAGMNNRRVASRMGRGQRPLILLSLLLASHGLLATPCPEFRKFDSPPNNSNSNQSHSNETGFLRKLKTQASFLKGSPAGEYIYNSLTSHHTYDRWSAIDTLKYLLFEPTNKSLLQWTALNETDHTNAIAAADALHKSGRDSETLHILCQRQLQDPDPLARQSALARLPYLTRKSQKLVEKLLTDSDRTVRLNALKTLQQLKAFSSAAAIGELLSHEDLRTRGDALQTLFKLGQIETVPPATLQKAGTELAKLNYPFAEDLDLYLNQNMLYHPLYRKVPNREKFFDPRGPVEVIRFEKTGGKTFLLGGPLAGKVVAKIISASAAVAWRKACDSKVTWKEAGFDYVPVEPLMTKEAVISQYRLDAAAKAALSTLESHQQAGEEIVYAQVLQGPQLEQLSAKMSEQDQNRIRHILASLGISHGHLDNHNFVVTHMDGIPRIYAIDFDRATLTPN